MTHRIALSGLLLTLIACGGGDGLDAGPDAAADARPSDGGPADTGLRDSGFADAAPADTGPDDDTGVAEDAAPPDAEAPDAEPADAGDPDAEPEDAAAEDATVEDASEPAVCGDGTVQLGEDCDDGNTADDGNGCSATCTRNDACGNGAVEALFELCDPGLHGCCNTTCDGTLVTGTTCRAAAGECDAPELCDGVALDCPADETEPDGTTCAGCPAGNTCSGCFGGTCLDSSAFCADILARGQSTGDGVYAVRPALTSSATPSTPAVSVYCDMTTDGGGWTMVYKKSRIVPGELSWSGSATNTADLTLLDRDLDPEDYNNAFQTQYWGEFTEARIEVVTGTIAQKFIHFNVAGTTPTSWFAPDRHIASSWSDLPVSPTWDNGSERAFRIGSGRTFYINRVWSGCPNDRGWLMISTIDFCYWEQTADPADILYSRLATESHIPTAAQTGRADTFIVFLR